MASSSSQPPDVQISQSNALVYWNSISPTVNGMLGGYPEVSRIDLRGSANFLATLLRQYPPPENQKTLGRGVDCGAGIGRVTTGFLSKVCDIVDIVEPVDKFAAEVKFGKMTGNGRLGEMYVTGLEDWKPEQRYDLIWNQWCLGHLTDEQLVSYFKRCSKALIKGGWIVVKENVSTNKDGADVFDEVDSSVTRTDKKFRKIFEEAQLLVLKTQVQLGLPKHLFPVRCYALRPKES